MYGPPDMIGHVSKRKTGTVLTHRPGGICWLVFWTRQPTHHLAIESVEPGSREVKSWETYVQNTSLSRAPAALPEARRGPWVKVHPDLAGLGKGALATVLAVLIAPPDVVVLDEDLIAWMKVRVPNLGGSVRTLQRYREQLAGYLSYTRTTKEGAVYQLHLLEEDGYLCVPVELLEHGLSAEALRLDLVLRGHLKMRDGARPGIKRLARLAGMSPSAAKRARQELRDAGLWSWEQRDEGPRRTCYYTPHLLPKEPAKKPRKGPSRAVDDNDRDIPDPQTRAIDSSLNSSTPPTPRTAEEHAARASRGRDWLIFEQQESPRPILGEGSELDAIAQLALTIFREEWARKREGVLPPPSQERILLKAAAEMTRRLEGLPAPTLEKHLPARLRGASKDIQVRALLRFMIQGLFLTEAPKRNGVALSTTCLFPQGDFFNHRLTDAKRAQTQRDLADWEPARDGRPADSKNRARYEQFLTEREKAEDLAKEQEWEREQVAPFLALIQMGPVELERNVAGLRDQLRLLGVRSADAWMPSEGPLLLRAAQAGMEVADLQSLYRRVLEEADGDKIEQVLDRWRLCRTFGVEPIVCPELVARAHVLGLLCEWTVPEPPTADQRERQKRIALRVRFLNLVPEGDVAASAAHKQREAPLDAKALEEVAAQLTEPRRAAFRAGLVSLAGALEAPLSRSA